MDTKILCDYRAYLEKTIEMIITNSMLSVYTGEKLNRSDIINLSKLYVNDLVNLIELLFLQRRNKKL